MIRLRVPPAGRMKGMRHRWMRFEPYRPQAYFRTPEGIRRKDRRPGHPPSGRRVGRIPFMRPATPRAPISPLCPFVGLTAMPFEEVYKSPLAERFRFEETILRSAGEEPYTLAMVLAEFADVRDYVPLTVSLPGMIFWSSARICSEKIWSPQFRPQPSGESFPVPGGSSQGSSMSGDLFGARFPVNT